MHRGSAIKWYLIRTARLILVHSLEFWKGMPITEYVLALGVVFDVIGLQLHQTNKFQSSFYGRSLYLAKAGTISSYASSILCTSLFSTAISAMELNTECSIDLLALIRWSPLINSPLIDLTLGAIARMKRENSSLAYRKALVV